jgi:hypothetical protein
MSDYDPNLKFSIKDDIAGVAERDTPQEIQVPSSYIGLAVWAAGRFGIALVAFYGMYLIYGDLKISNDRVLSVFEANTRSQTEFKNTLENNNKAILQVLQKMDSLEKKNP